MLSLMISKHRFAWTLLSRRISHAVSTSSKREAQQTRHASMMTAWKIHDSYDNSSEVCVKNKLKSSKVRVPTINAPSDVLVKVYATSVNPLDVRMCYGYGRRVLDLLDMITNPEVRITNDRYPLTLGRDFSGEIVALGPSCSQSLRVGDFVFGPVEPQRSGAHAEFVSVPETCVTRKPDNLSHLEAASVPFVALTAYSALNCFGHLTEKNCKGKDVLILGGSGGVGTFAIQLLKIWGANVMATCSEEKINYLEDTLFVNRAVSYDDSSQLETFRGCFDFVLDCGDYKQKEHAEIVSDGTRFLKPRNQSVYVTLSPPILKNIDKQGVVFGGLHTAFEAAQDTFNALRNLNSARWAVFMPNKRALDYVSKLYQHQMIIPQIHSTHPFDRLPDAYEELQSGSVMGKVIVDMTRVEDEGFYLTKDDDS